MKRARWKDHRVNSFSQQTPGAILDLKCAKLLIQTSHDLSVWNELIVHLCTFCSFSHPLQCASLLCNTTVWWMACACIVIWGISQATSACGYHCFEQNLPTVVHPWGNQPRSLLFPRQMHIPIMTTIQHTSIYRNFIRKSTQNTHLLLFSWPKYTMYFNLPSRVWRCPRYFRFRFVLLTVRHLYIGTQSDRTCWYTRV